MYNWYVVTVSEGSEKKVKGALDQAIQSKGLSKTIVEVLLPTRQVSGNEKLIYPGFLFLKMELDDKVISFVKQVPGITGFIGVTGGTSPQPLAAGGVDILNHSNISSEKLTNFQVGNTVKITTGPFNSFKGKIIDVDLNNSEIMVEITVFGKKTKAELHFDEVELIG